jgi:UDP-N-acetylmuramate--alanine ligase
MGIGGFGINPIARVMHAFGYAVSGCDLAESPLIDPLRQMGVPVEIGHHPDHVERYAPDALVISSAVPPDNAEVQAAAVRGLPVYKRADILCALMRERTGVAVAGTHGKTTTSALLAWTLTACGLDPTFIVGGVLQDLGTNAQAGQGKPFVIEADEYDRMFMGLCPQIAVVTTLEMDHPDMFGSLGEVRALFEEFAGLLPEDGLLIAGYDDPEARRLAETRREKGLPALTYGLRGGDWTADEIAPNPAGGMSFSARRGGEMLGRTSLRLPGSHNVQNALAALAVADALGAPLQPALGALGTFSGVGRRFEVRGEAQGVTVVDDYAHHPTAIRATLEAARTRYAGRVIWAVWQPHTYSRTRALLDEFAASFASADHVIITDVYRSRDPETYGVGPEDVLARMGHPDAQHIGGLDEVVAHLARSARPGDVVIVMSAGDATRVSDGLLAVLGLAGG